MTPAEKRVYALVRNRRFLGLKFLRQHPIRVEIDNQKRFFVPDFYCAAKKLVLEIDGAVHDNTAEYDALRTWIINQLGIRVERIQNEDALPPDRLTARPKEIVEGNK